MKQYVGHLCSIQGGDPAELPVSSTSDVLFPSYCILVKVHLLNSPHSQMVFIDLMYAEKADLQRCSISPGCRRRM